MFHTYKTSEHQGLSQASNSYSTPTRTEVRNRLHTARLYVCTTTFSSSIPAVAVSVAFAFAFCFCFCFSFAFALALGDGYRTCPPSFYLSINLPSAAYMWHCNCRKSRKFLPLSRGLYNLQVSPVNGYSVRRWLAFVF